MTFERLQYAIYPLIGTLGILGLWQIYTDVMNINTIVLPSPLDIGRAMIEDHKLLAREAWPTFKGCVYGFGLAVIIGIPIAVCIANSRILNLTFFPILIATQSVPKVAIAPIILIWFGTGLESKLAISFLVAFFPMVVDTATGLRATPRDLVDLAHSLKASPMQLFWKVQFPAALPFVFSGAKIAVTLAVIGTVIGEFVGSSNGLGNLLLVANSQLDSPLAWASLVWLSMLGIGLFLAVVAAERVLMPWGLDGAH
jgi:NitT/TauT family transport system permease protein